MADNPIKHSDIIQPGDPFKDTIRGLEKMIKLLKEAAKDYLAFAQKQNTATKQGQKNIQAAAQATQQLSIKEKEAIKLKNQLAVLQAKQSLMNTKDYKDKIKVTAAINAQNAAMRKAAKNMETGAKSTNTWGTALGSFMFKFNALGNMAANVASKITRTFSRAVRGAISTIMDFEQAMADTRSVTLSTDKQFKELSKSARDLGGSTKFTAIEVAKLQKEYAKLGFTTPEILKVTEATLALAAATNTELARAAEVVGITLRQFGLDASQTGRVVDVMAKSFASSPLDMEKFAEAMKMVGPAAAASNISLETSTAMLMQLAEAGISGTMAGTSLRGVMLGLAKESGTLSEKIARVSEKGLDLAGASALVQRRAATALIVLGNGVDTLGDYEAALAKAAGTAQQMADTQLDTLQNQIVILKSGWNRLILSVATSEEQFIFLKAVIAGTSAGINKMADGVEDNHEQQTKFNKALGDNWKIIKRSIPIWGTMGIQQEIVTAKLIEQKNAADALKESFEELEDALPGGVAAFFAGDDDEVVIKANTLAAFDKQLKDLNDTRMSASLAEIGAINNEITALEEKIRKYKEAGQAMPKIAEVQAYADEEIKIDAVTWERKQNTEEQNLKFRKAKSKQFREEDKTAKAKQDKDDKDAEDQKQAKIAATFQLASDITSTFSDLFSAQKEKELSMVGDNAEKRAEIEKKYAKREQAMAIANAVINGALAITKIAGQLGAFSIPLIVASAALTAAQIGVIASQKFGEGEVDINGPSHSRGGINAEIEGGESVINKRSTSKYKTLLEAINTNDTAAIADAALNNSAFHEVWGRTMPRNIEVHHADQWTKKIYETLNNMPTIIPEGKRTERYPNGRTRIING